MEQLKPDQILANVAWRVLFGEDIEDIPDINKPENSAYVNAKRKEHDEKFKQFVEGPGNILFEKWQSRVRSGVFNIMNPGNVPECNCALATEVKGLQFLFQLLSEAHATIEGTK